MIIIMNSNELAYPLRNIDVALARAFVATAETGSMTAAARLLNVTQGAVSQQVKRLEDLLQKHLFDRHRRQLTLTAEGERLLLHARRLIALNDEIWSLMNQPEFEGTVRLGVPGDIIRPFLPPILRSFKDAWPRVNLELVCESSVTLRDALTSGDIDLTLTTESDTPAGAERLLTENLVWIGCRGGQVWREEPLPVGNANPACTFRAAMLGALEQMGRDWRIVGPFGHDVMLAKIEADLAVTALLQSTVPNHLEILGKENGLPELTPFHINLYVRTSQTNEIVQELANHIRTQFVKRFSATSDFYERLVG